MHFVPCFRRPTTTLVGSVLVLALITAACSGGSSPSAPSPASLPAASTMPPPPASPPPPATAPPATEPPAAPDGIDYGIERGIAGGGGLVMTRYTVSWTAPLDPGTTISVVGITSCPNEPTPDGVPCVTKRTSLPAKIRTLIARGPAESGSISWDWPEADVDGPVLAYADGVSYYAFVMRAVNAAGRSPFVVVRSTVACSDCMS